MDRRTVLSAVAGSLSAPSLARGYRGYERRYEPVSPSNFDVGVVYIPFIGDKFGDCITERVPAVGYYDMTDSRAINRHVDQMQGHGVSTLMFNFGEADPDFDRYRQFRRAELADEIDLEAFWVINRIFQRDLDLERYLDFMREEMLKRDNYSRHEGRPVVQCWGADYLRWHDETREHLRSEYGGLAEFVEHVRDRLSVGGTEPYLVAREPDPGVYPEFGRAFDGYADWFAALGRLGQPSWDEFVAAKVEIAERVRSFADQHDRDFLPMAVPGFDDRANACWGDDRHVPRSPDNLSASLAVADDYATRDRISIATFNDWTEGHQIEPGTMHGDDYGTDYLERVREFALRKEFEGRRCESGRKRECLR